MPGQRLRRLPDIKPTLDQRIVLSLYSHNYNSLEIQDIDPVLDQCWARDSGFTPTFNQHRISVLCLLGSLDCSPAGADADITQIITVCLYQGIVPLHIVYSHEDQQV